MKVLAICKEHKGLHHLSGDDYLQNSLLHGFRSIYGIDVVDVPKCESIYYSFYPHRQFTHGQGFTNRAVLPDVSMDRSNIEQKINDHYYDVIIYLTVLNLPYLDIVTQAYKPHEVIFCDGRDSKDITWALVPLGRYFKRELYDESPLIRSITFSFPAEKINWDASNHKTQIFSRSAPTGGLEIFDDVVPEEGYDKARQFEYIAASGTELQYYQEYQTSFFGITCRKAGWDCMRHYEITFNHCLPYFPDIARCPPRCLFNWRKDLLAQILTLPGVSYKSMDDTFDKGHYSDILQQMFQHALEHHTTVGAATYILGQL